MYPAVCLMRCAPFCLSSRCLRSFLLRSLLLAHATTASFVHFSCHAAPHSTCSSAGCAGRSIASLQLVRLLVCPSPAAMWAVCAALPVIDGAGTAQRPNALVALAWLRAGGWQKLRRQQVLRLIGRWVRWWQQQLLLLSLYSPHCCCCSHRPLGAAA